MSYDGVSTRAVMRSVAFLTAGALAVPLLAACGGGEDEAGKPLAVQQISPAARDLVADGGSLRWAVDDVPDTFNTFQADADAATTRVAQAVLPAMYRLDANGRPERDADYLESAKVVETEPQQVVLYRLNQQAVWSDGREIGAADFAAQWRALSGKDSAYWTARNAGYDRIEKVERGANDLEVRVTFSRPYADWQSLFSPLYPKDVMGTPDAFNEGARRKLRTTAGVFTLAEVDRKNDRIRLTRNARWWGRPAKLSEIVLTAVPRAKRAAALAAGTVDLADIDPADAARVTEAAKGTAGPRAGRPGPAANSLKAALAKASTAAREESDEYEEDGADRRARAAKKLRKAVATWEKQQQTLKGFEVRKSLEPAYTQLAMNGESGPLADERVRRAVARALDRTALAGAVLTPLGLPADPVGSHLALAGQDAYADGSGALGGQDTAESQALLADAGWVAGGPVVEKKPGEKGAGPQRESESEGGDDGTYIVGDDDKAPGAAPAGKTPSDDASAHAQDGKQYARQGGAPGAYAPKGTPAPGGAAGPLAKDGKALSLRFVVPSGPGSESLRVVADRVTRMLAKVGIRTDVTKVPDESYFKDHVASGQYDLALYSWPASAFPATDARPIYSKPVPAADGSLSVEQNYTRVGTDQVDQLFDQALSTLDADESRALLRKADSRIWAAAGSIPLYQRPQLTAAVKNLVNAGAFGFQTPVFEDMGFLKKGARVSPSPTAE
ncbi:ABC transporter family substrate-binding protein [Streptomyces roseirectus]|uniref:ABC transporter family substrate-binding protein n=1 Tax=Streptomyces roseirectus TaxID=2768066 RepID=A0A7H0ICA6_9ACTN|nr:ABC transporter family substrate-binding protein [Streptomyces roseirectus]QNP70422.1 ABC transporter family substrate-binding protein [Streptomyces roseirectus]